MSFANANISDIIATTIQNRSKKIADNVTKNNALLAKLASSGGVRTVSGGSIILEELSFAENANAGFYSGYDLLPIAAQDVVSAAEFTLKQLACPVIISGLEQLQNSGKEAFIDLLEARMAVAESTMSNKLCGSIYSDGTGNGGKEVVGLNAAVPVSPATGVYGGIDRATFAFWRSQVADVKDYASAKPGPVSGALSAMWAKLVRGSDRPNLIVMDSVMWTAYLGELQNQQRFTSAETGNLGFPSVKFMDCDVVLDGGIGGFCPPKTAFMLNTKYLSLRPHKDRNMVPLSPNKRVAINQDAEVQILAWAGAMTCRGAQFQGRLVNTTA
jgi:hypothetical protein